MANATKAKEEELKDWMRYTKVKAAPYLSGDIEEIVALETKYPSPVDGFRMRWMRSKGLLKPLPLVKFGGKRKRTRRGKRRYTRNATQSHRRIET
jgi:hypothetical protein